MDNTLEWYAKVESTDTYSPTNEIYGGTLNKNNQIHLFLQLWNNRFGDTNVPDFSNFNINMFFEHEEDKTLLDFCKVYVNNHEVEIQKVDNYGIINMNNIVLSGEKNDGLEKNSPSNFCNINIEILSTENKNFKPADLKNLYFEIIQF